MGAPYHCPALSSPPPESAGSLFSTFAGRGLGLGREWQPRVRRDFLNDVRLGLWSLSANIATPLHRLACLKRVLPSRPIPMLS